MAFAFISTMIWRSCYLFLSKYAFDIIHPKFSRIILTFFGLGWALAGMTRTIYIILHLSEHASSIPMFFSEKWNKPQFDAETFPNRKQKPSPVEHFHFYVQILLHFTFDLPREFCSLYFTLFRGKYFSDFCALHFGIQS